VDTGERVVLICTSLINLRVYFCYHLYYLLTYYHHYYYYDWKHCLFCLQWTRPPLWPSSTKNLVY